MKKAKQWLIVGVLACLLVAVPLIRKYGFGMELRLVPGAVKAQQETVVSTEQVEEQTAEQPSDFATDGALQIEYDYGYYPDDKWVEEKCGFYVSADQDGTLILKIYYPFEITGNQIGHVFTDGQHYADFCIEDENMEINIPYVGNKKLFIQVNSDFAKEPGEKDKRALAFVLLDVDYLPNAEALTE